MRRALAAGGAALATVAMATSAPAMPPDRPAKTPVAASGERGRKGGISRSELKRRLGNEVRSAGAASGAYVYDMYANHHRTLFSWNARTSRIPASNEKLFTTAAVMDRFGARNRLETRIYKHGHRNGRDDHVLHGSLVIVGGGDPALATESFARNHGLPLTPLAELARDVNKAGIGRVTGDIRADDHIFDRRRGVGSTGWRAGPYLNPLSGLSFDSGLVDGHQADNPELVAARELKSMLQHRGIQVEGDVGRANLRRRVLEREPLGLVRSPRIATLAAATNKPSNNFFAEMLLKRLAARPGTTGTTKRGANTVEALADHAGTGVHAVDGSGLGRNNRVNPRQVTKLLTAMAKDDENGNAYRDSLPIAGREGTVAQRMRGTAAQDRCRTKTGTLHDVSALSGYCHAGHGQIAFSILMNSVSDFDAARRAQDQMAATIARYRP